MSDKIQFYDGKQKSEFVNSYENVDALNELAWELKTQNSEKSQHLSEESLRLSREINYSKGMACSLLTMAYLDFLKAKYEDCLQQASIAGHLFRELKLSDWQGITSNLIGNAYWKTGKYHDAIERFKDTLTYNRLSNDKFAEAKSLNNLGAIYSVVGGHEEAIGYMAQALSVSRETGNIEKEIDVLHNIAVEFETLGNYENTLNYLTQCLKLVQANKIESHEATLLSDIGHVYWKLGNHKEAEQFHLKALAIPKKADDKAHILKNLGNLYFELGKHEKALAAYLESIALLQGRKDQTVLTISLMQAGLIYEEQGELQKAVSFYTQSLTLATQTGQQYEKAECRHLLGKFYTKQYKATKHLADFEKSLSCLSDALAAATGLKETLHHVHLALCELYKTSGDLAKALEHHEAFHRIKEEVFNENSDKQIRNLQVVHQVEQTKRDAELEKQKLLELDRLKSRFFSNLSHEFRTPLTLILSPLEDLLAAPAPKGKKSYRLVREQTLAVMQQNATSLLATINDLLDFAKLDAGKLKPQVERRKMMQFIKGIASSFSEMAEQQNIQFAVQVEAEDGDAFFDKDKLEKVMTNLLSNAFKFTPSGGSISVTATQTPASATITVQDSGIGIPANELPRIYDRFYQVDTKGTAVPQSRTKQGTGIGLAFTKELVELCHGSIAVQSEVGKGTTFVLTLPTAKEAFKPDEIIDRSNESESQPRKQSVMRPQVSTSSKQERLVKDGTVVLVVEDNPDMRSYIKQCFLDDASQGKAKSKKTTYVVIEAANGSEAFDQAVADVPDIIVADVMMPVMDGYEMSRRLKKTEATSHIPIILLTAKSSGESKVEGLEIGVDEYLTKPFRSKELLVRTQNLIEQRNRLRDRYRKELLIQPKKFKADSADEKFLKRAVTLIEQHLDDEQYGVEAFARDIGLSRSQLHRKLVALIHQSPHDFIQSVRLKRAADLLKQSVGTISQIAFMTGFGSHAHFAKCFREQFGISPSRYKSR